MTSPQPSVPRPTRVLFDTKKKTITIDGGGMTVIELYDELQKHLTPEALQFTSQLELVGWHDFSTNALTKEVT